MIQIAAAALIIMTLAHPPAYAAPAVSKDSSTVVGIGLEIKIEDGYPVVQSLIPGGPAAKDGSLSFGDRIEGVAQGDEPWQATAGLKLSEVVAMIRGKRGSKVSVRATRATEDGARVQVIVELTRDMLKPRMTPPKK